MDDEDRIRRHAYAIWEAEGRPDGRHEEHWQRAVQEIAAERTGGASARAEPEASQGGAVPSASPPKQRTTGRGRAKPPPDADAAAAAQILD
jgi:hypothetical protein